MSASYELRKRFADDIKWGTLGDGTVNPNTLNAMEKFHNKAMAEASLEAVRQFATDLLAEFEKNATQEEFSYLDDCIQKALAPLVTYKIPGMESVEEDLKNLQSSQTPIH